MKLLITLLCATFFLSQGIGQVTERKVALSLGEQNAFSMDYKDAEKKMVEKAIDEAIKNYGKVKRNRKADEWNCLQCQAPAVSSSPLNIYYKIEEGKGQMTSYIFFDDGTKFISSENDSDAAKAIDNINMSIKYDVQRMVIEEELKDEEKNLKSVEKDLSKLVDKNEDLHNDIEDYKKKISEAENDIVKNLQEQEDKKMEIEKQKRIVEKVTDALNSVGRN